MDSSAMIRTPSLGPIGASKAPILVEELDLGLPASRTMTEVDFNSPATGRRGATPRHATVRVDPLDAGKGTTGSANEGCFRRVEDFIGVPPHLSVGTMILQLGRLQISATATTVLYFCNQAITMMFVGQLVGTEGLAHFSVGISVFNIAGLSIGVGMATALDTLVSQAYGRNTQSQEVGVLLQRGLIVCWLLIVPVMFAFYQSQPILVQAFGESLGNGVFEFLSSSPPYLFLLVTNFCIQKTLQAQQLPEIPVYANIVSALACPLLNYYLTPFGMTYALMAATLSVGIAVCVMAVGAVFHPRSIIMKAPWPAASALNPKGVWQFLEVGVPGLMSVVAEWWAFELIIAFSSRYGESVVTGFTVSMSILTFMFAIPSGLAVAAGVLCGNYLGMNDARGARAFALIAIVGGLTLMAMVNGALLYFGEKVFRLYTHDENVLTLVRGIIHLLLLFHACDSTQTILQGIFRSVGRQAMSARIVVVSLWFVGLPASWYLGAHREPLEGIMMGLIVGFAFEIPLLYLDMLARWDWEEMARVASRPTADGGGVEDDPEAVELTAGSKKTSYGSTS